MKKVVLVLIVLAIVPSLILSSCKKKVDCPGLPEQMENYFPNTGDLKFINGQGDTLVLASGEYSRSEPRTLSNNPLSVGGTGMKPVCYETIQTGSSQYNPIGWSFELGVYDDEKSTSIRFNLTEEFVSNNYFEAVVNETPSSLGDYKVFGDTLDMVAIPVTNPRFTEARIVYGLGVVKLHDVMNNCDWTRVW